MFARLALATIVMASSGLARAQAADGGAPADGGAAPVAAEAQATAKSAHAGSPIAEARDQFDFGDYQGVVERLRPIIDSRDLTRELPQKADRLEALRIYGIACTLTDRKTSAEGAFLLLLREEPSTRLDPALVRPEAVTFFDEVRARHHDDLLAAYRKTRPRYYWPVDLIPVAGQLQNRQWRKAVMFGVIELALLAANITTWKVLDYYQGDHHDFMSHGGDHTNLYEPLRGVNISSFAGLLAVTSAGIIDAFVVGKKRQEREQKIEARLGL